VTVNLLIERFEMSVYYYYYYYYSQLSGQALVQSRKSISFENVLTAFNSFFWS